MIKDFDIVVKAGNELGLHLTRAYIDRKPFEILLNLESKEAFNAIQLKPILVSQHLINMGMQKSRGYG